MRKRKYKVVLLGIFLILFSGYLSIPDGKLRMIFCDVGQGDGAILVRGNWQMLVDTGADNGKMEKCLDRFIPFWDRKIESVVISHWDKDHSGALPKILRNYQVDYLVESTSSGQLVKQGTSTEVFKAGDMFKSGGINFEVIYPREVGKVKNESSLVMVMNYFGRKLMFTGDVDVRGEGEMMGWWKDRVEGIKVSHHGSDTGNSEEWLSRLDPALAVISVGKNSYGHPKELVLKRLAKQGAKIFRTDVNGDVVLGWN